MKNRKESDNLQERRKCISAVTNCRRRLHLREFFTVIKRMAIFLEHVVNYFDCFFFFFYRISRPKNGIRYKDEENSVSIILETRIRIEKQVGINFRLAN